MDPKLYFLFVLFSIIVVSASHENLREFARKLRFSLSRKDNEPSRA
jgi:hypothetical protein